MRNAIINYVHVIRQPAIPETEKMDWRALKII